MRCTVVCGTLFTTSSRVGTTVTRWRGNALPANPPDRLTLRPVQRSVREDNSQGGGRFGDLQGNATPDSGRVHRPRDAMPSGKEESSRCTRERQGSSPTNREHDTASPVPPHGGRRGGHRAVEHSEASRVSRLRYCSVRPHGHAGMPGSKWRPVHIQTNTASAEGGWMKPPRTQSFGTVIAGHGVVRAVPFQVASASADESNTPTR